MSCSVNLLPKQRLEHAARRRRRHFWGATVAVLALLVLSGWAVQGGARSEIRRLGEAVKSLQSRRDRLADQQAALVARRGALQERLRIAADARRCQVWPAHLSQLATAAPSGVFLTSLTIAPGGAGITAPARSSRPGPAPAGGSPSPPVPNVAARPGQSAGLPAPTSQPPTAPVRTVQLQGYAIHHAALAEFLNGLQKLPGWQAPSLIRATLESFPSGPAVSFEIASRVTEELP